MIVGKSWRNEDVAGKQPCLIFVKFYNIYNKEKSWMKSGQTWCKKNFNHTKKLKFAKFTQMSQL
jgi:hypothetical protein